MPARSSSRSNRPGSRPRRASRGGCSGASPCADSPSLYSFPREGAWMRIVVVGMEEGDPLAERLAAARHGTQVLAARGLEPDGALAAADLVVLAPACVARADVVATVHAVRRACGSVPILAVGREDRA